MTKRFSQKNEDDWEILDRTHHFAYAHSGYQASKIIDELNELVDTNRELYRENEQLKQQLSDREIEWLQNNTVWEQMPTNRKTTSISTEFNQSNCITVQKAKIKDLEKENEQLKSELSEKDIQLDFLKDENKHMRDLVNENEQLKQQIKKIKKDVDALSCGEADWLIEEEL